MIFTKSFVKRKSTKWLKNLNRKKRSLKYHMYISRTGQTWRKSPYLDENVLHVYFLARLRSEAFSWGLRIRCVSAWRRYREDDYDGVSKGMATRRFRHLYKNSIIVKSCQVMESRQYVRVWMKNPMWVNDRYRLLD